MIHHTPGARVLEAVELVSELQLLSRQTESPDLPGGRVPRI